MALRIPKRLDRAALYDYAIRALARRSLTVSELRRRLESKAADAADVPPVIRRLKEIGYLNDANLAESYSRFRRDWEALGKTRVLQELRRRGVQPSVAEKAVEQAYAETDELDLIRSHLQKKLGRRPGGAGRTIEKKRLVSLYRALIRAGFSSAKIVVALKEISPNSDWLDAFAEHDYPAPHEEEAFD